MLALKRDYYSRAEYLALEEGAETKSEYYRGEIFAMAGASKNHNRIARNLVVALESQLSHSPCETFIGDIRVYVARHDLYTYPDVLVVCGETVMDEGRDDTITNPQVIVEVLSKSTKGYDKGDKFRFYQSLPSLQEYVLIDQERAFVQHYRKTMQNTWLLTEWSGLDKTLILPTIECAIPLSQIYDRVEGLRPVTLV